MESTPPTKSGSSHGQYNEVETPVLGEGHLARSTPGVDAMLESSHGQEHEQGEDANLPPKAELREVFFNYAPGNAVFERCTNVIVTSKYSMITFLPRFLFESFTKVANFFFLVVCVLQSIKSISNTYGIPSNAPVLFFVISIDAVFAVMEDLRRHRSDTQANSATCHIVRNDQIEDHKWAEVQVGDFLVIRNREVVPADVLVLSVAEPDAEIASGICYVETKSLDGETNLKLRQAISATMRDLSQPDQVAQLRGVVRCEQPNPYINKFAGKVEASVGDKAAETAPISVKNILLRGCNLRNTDWVYGLVLNTGPDTKIMQSASSPPSKWSDIMLQINRMIGVVCALLFVACAVAAACYITYQYDIVDDTWYILTDVTKTPRWQSFIQMTFYYFLLLYQVIPISLYVSMTSVKFLQSCFMAWDLEMYHAETDTPAIVRTMELNEELGQISYVFSDKTGTLTCNVMEFRKCSINGVSYGSGITEIGRAALLRANKPIPAEPKLDPGVQKMPYVNFVDPALFRALDGKSGEQQQQYIYRFFEHLAVCHTVIPETLDNGETRLSASSPDEQALVAGAAFCGFSFKSRSVGRVKVEVLGEMNEYEVLDVLEFNSTRKRMSVVVRRPDGQLFLYCKGADMMIYQRLKDDPSMDRIKKVTMEHMEKYADDGLRTLALAVKRLDEHEFEAWKEKYDDAIGDVGEIERRKEGKPNSIDDLMEEIEEGLELIGATAIEDKLQEGVPTCLGRLTTAEIKVWMLTGDKEETAINIAYACSLLENAVHQVVINTTTCPTEESLRQKLMDALYEYEQRKKQEPSLETALIIDGEALEWALTEQTAPHLLEYTKHCRAVVCNRVSPAQKAEMVRLVRDNMEHVRTLAIGDGANDVAMIQAAHVGVGISGQEGMQAVNSSDYAIAQFRYLERLLLVHGRWNYLRISKLVLYMFYKNITLVLAQYWYGYLSGASGSKLYWEFGVQVYNILFTGLPIIFVGVMDKDLPAHMSIDHPRLYRNGPERQNFNFYTFLRWLAAAVYESLIIFVVMSFGFNASEGMTGSESRVEMGMVAFSMVVLVVNLKIWLIADTWTTMSFVGWIVSVLLWFVVATLGTVVPYAATFKIGYDEFGAFIPTAATWGYILVVVMGCTIALARHIAWNLYQRMFYPSLAQVLKETANTEKRRYTIHNIEEQTLSMTLHDVAGYDGNADDGRKTSRTVDTFISNAPAKRTPSPPSMKEKHSSPQMPQPQQAEVYDPSVCSSAPQSASSHTPSTSVYNAESVNSAGNSWQPVTQLYMSGPSRRNTGFAFSCDEETTLAESYIASNSMPRSDAIGMAQRNSAGDRRSTAFRMSEDSRLGSNMFDSSQSFSTVRSTAYAPGAYKIDSESVPHDARLSET